MEPMETIVLSNFGVFVFEVFVFEVFVFEVFVFEVLGLRFRGLSFPNTRYTSEVLIEPLHLSILSIQRINVLPSE